MMKHRKIICAAALCLLLLPALLWGGLLPSLGSSAQGLQMQSPTVGLTDWQQKVDPDVLSKATAGPTEFLIYMREQADLSGAARLGSKAEKGRHVHERLTATANATQSNVKQTLVQLGAEHQAFWVTNAVWAKGGLAVVQAVASLPEVASILPSGSNPLKLPPQELSLSSTNAAQSPGIAAAAAADLNPEANLTQINADDVWALGYLGQGVVVASADTGVSWQHAALKNKYRGWNGSDANHNYNWHDAIHAPNVFCPGDSPEPCDDDELLGGGHGSHTTGTMVGDDGADNRIGMAPDAKWVACRNLNSGVGAIPTYMECMQWFIAPTNIANEMPDPSKAPDVINNSWGCVEGCPQPALQDVLRASRAAGIFYAVSAGNDGSNCNTLQFPLARYPESFTVGATDHRTDLVASFSSRGPVIGDPDFPGQMLLKPNISAPGVRVRSAQRDGSYALLSGTSMAGPHVAGLVALVLSSNPNLSGKVGRVEDIIEQTAVRRTTTQGCGGDSSSSVPNNVYGFGRIDALAAVLEATRLFNYGLTSLGSVAAASSTYTSRNYAAGAAFDGDRKGTNWEAGGGWNDNTRGVWGDTLDVTFSRGAKTISEVRVYTLQNNFRTPVEPDDNTDASIYGIRDFDVQAADASAPGGWRTVASVTGNTKARRALLLDSPVTTTGLRIVVHMGRAHFSRIVEVEALGLSDQ